jgi:hypothetical protein
MRERGILVRKREGVLAVGSYYQVGLYGGTGGGPYDMLRKGAIMALDEEERL